ncbi:Zinc finger, RING/FYVE/PHD-type [Akanthomyces lecanii RCEF 1005]|uniref:RING-type E3 ubiquitin transferase n=1 Tax=Akanthomyces lecanii RCEF 1005 TaxID=1081108 RepID=A0A162K395_CORDF|nr:Zinc finger, RING/FYVE/PHD-type [Akanthomyces lecanii RCEF 1005]
MAASLEISDEDHGPAMVATAAASAMTSPEDPDGPDCCAICLEPVTAPCEVVPCGHVVFDLPCVLGWLALHPSCPLCKTPVVRLLHGASGELGRPYSEFHDPATGARRPPSRSTGLPTPAPTPPPPPHPIHRPAAAREEGEPRAVAVRRDVYRRNRFSMHVGSNPVSRYRELTAAMFQHDEQLVSRARMFIRRELRVFTFLTANRAPPPTPPSGHALAAAAAPPPLRRRAPSTEFLLEFIVSMLKSVEMMGNRGAAQNTLADYLGREFARLFLHELRSWLRSPYTSLEEWDRAVQYPPLVLPLPGGGGVEEARPTRQATSPPTQLQEASSQPRVSLAPPRITRPRSQARTLPDNYRPAGRYAQRRPQLLRPPVRSRASESDDLQHLRRDVDQWIQSRTQGQRR